MKKQLVLILSLIFMFTILVGCNKEEAIENIDIINLPEQIEIGTFDECNIKFNITYSDDTTELVDVKEKDIPEEYQHYLYEEGTHNFSFLYKGYKVKFNITMYEVKYTVKFINVLDEVVKELKVKKNEKVEYPTKEEMYVEGYRFLETYDKDKTYATSDVEIKGNYVKTWIVKFYNGLNEVISTQIVDDKSSAQSPSEEDIKIDGYTFIMWDKGYTNITKNTNIFGIYEKGNATCVHNIVDATCTEPSYCTKCNKTFGDALGHDETDWIIDEDSTCQKEGTKHTECERCKETIQTASIPTKEHNYTLTTINPTCTERGCTVHICTVCGHTYKDTYVNILGHDFVISKQKDATCTEDGYIEYKCSYNCGETKKQIILAYGHDFDENGVCKECGYKLENHTHEYKTTVIAPTCTSMGYTLYECSCGHTYKDNYIEQSRHNWDEGTIIKAPTCTVDGQKEYKCKDCQATMIHIIKAEHDYKITVNKKATCTVDGEYTKECSRCGHKITEIEEAHHIWTKDVVVKQPTCKETGIGKRTCGVCGIEETYVIDKTGHKYVNGICTECGEHYMDHITTSTHPIYGMYFEIEETLSDYGPEIIDEYGVLLDYNEDAQFDKVAVYLTQDGTMWRRAIACTGSNIDYATYVPYLSYGENILYTGLNSNYINIFNLRENSDGIWTYSNYTTIGVNLENNKGDLLLTLSDIGQAGKQTRIFDNLAEMIAWLKNDDICIKCNYTTKVVNPTCEEEGYTLHTCTVCGNTYKDTYVDALGHDLVTETTPATCTQDGQERTYCKREGCTYEETKVLPAGHNYTTKVVNPTCEEEGYTLHTCTVCDNTYKDTYVDALGHDETDWIIDEDSTCTKEGTKHTECEICGKNPVRTGTIPKIDHNYVNNKCTMCGKEKEQSHVSLKPYEENGKTYINFGRYPQTVVTDTNLIKELDKITITNEFGYIEYNGNEYKKQVADRFNSNSIFQNGNEVVDGKAYYFKVEPIKWRVLETTNGSYKLLSEYLLDTQQFYTSTSNRTLNGQKIYANNYEYSTIRAWLNGYNGTSYNVEDYTNKGFIDIAFTEEEKAIIKTTLVDNSVSSAGYSENQYSCDNTNDKIYLLSYKEVTNTTYGFSSSSYDDSRRKVKTTDYAAARYCYMYLGNGEWWLRSPNDCSSQQVRYVSPHGGVNYNNNVINRCCGVRAALEINHNYTTTIVNPTCEEQGYTLHTCKECGYVYKDTYVDALGHKETDWIIDENPTCTKEGTKHTECERCGKNPVQTGTISSHNYVNNKCTMCGKGEFDPYIENGKTYINFGRYPQTVVTDTNLIKELDKITITNKYGYIEYNGNEYKKQVAEPCDSDSIFQNGNEVVDGATYYFKVEPIKWRVLETSNGSYKLLSEYLLDTQQFYTSLDSRTLNGQTIYANNYEYSTIRAWLNGYNGTSYGVEDYTNKGFIDIAFTEEEQAIIKTTLLDNSASSTGYSENQYACNNTYDKIYLLSLKEAENTTYGFSSKASREAQPTDYAAARDCCMGSNGNGLWWLRSPYVNLSHLDGSDDARNVSSDGSLNFINRVRSGLGVRAALEINLTI